MLRYFPTLKGEYMEYNWYHTYIKQKYHELRKLQKIQDSLEIRKAIASIEAELLPEPRVKKQKTREIFLNEYQEFKKAKFLWDDLTTFTELSQTPITFDPQSLITNFSDEELFTLSHDFYKNATTEELFAQFMHFFKQRNRNVHFFRNSKLDFYANVFYLPYYHELFMHLKPRGEFGDVAVLNHEYGHGIHFLNNFHGNFYGKNIFFIEIISTFFEYLTLLYYSQNGNYQYAALNSLIDTFEERKGYAENIKTFISYIDYMGLEGCGNKLEELKVIDNYLSYYGNTNIEELYTEGKISEDILYVFATIIVCELLNIYLDDPPKAFFLLNQLMNINPALSPEEYYEEILNLGIYPNNSVLNFNDHLKRELTRFK